jgi:hypothetical protein
VGVSYERGTPVGGWVFLMSELPLWVGVSYERGTPVGGRGSAVSYERGTPVSGRGVALSFEQGIPVGGRASRVLPVRLDGLPSPPRTRLLSGANSDFIYA